MLRPSPHGVRPEWSDNNRERHMPVKKGWTGRVYEDFEVGDTYRHPVGRTVIDADNIWFHVADAEQQSDPLRPRLFRQDRVREAAGRFDLHASAGDRTVDHRPRTERDGQPRLGRGSAAGACFEGDTIYSQSEVLATRESKSRPNVGIVTVKTVGFNQDGTVVIEFKRTFMVYRRDHLPDIERVTPRLTPQA